MWCGNALTRTSAAARAHGTYIEHQAGVADDTALELASAARAIDSGATPVAVVTGWGKDLEAVSEALGPSYGEVWKIAHPELAYPNAELVRKALLETSCLAAAWCWRRTRIRNLIWGRGSRSS